MKNIKIILEKVYSDLELRKRVVPLFLSNPGLGKTQIIEEFAKEKKATLVELIASQISPFEVSGICIPSHSKEKMVYYDYDRIDNLKDGDILFFDELLAANPVVLSACLTLIEQRRTISGKDLPKIMIVAAANPQNQTPISPAIKERFIWYDIKFDKDMWIAYMKEKYGITPTIGQKLSALVAREDFTGNNFNSPRSLDKAVSMIIKNCPTPYSDLITPILSEMITNEMDKPIVLSKTRTLLPGEMMSWLDLIRYKQGDPVPKTTKPTKAKKDTFTLPAKWCIQTNNKNREVIRDFIKEKGYVGWNHNDDWLVHYPFLGGGSLYSHINTGYIEITFEQFKKYVLNNKE